jgi:gas vesicle protein
MSENNNELGSFLAGFIIGGLVGAAVALLTAPQSGEETRKYISDKSIELKNTAVEKAEQARVKAEAAAAEAQHYADDLKKRTQEFYTDQKGKLQRNPKEAAGETPGEVPAP